MPRLAPLPRSRFGPTARVTDVVIRRMTGKSFEGTGILARDPALLRARGGMERYFLSRRRKTEHRILELATLRAAMEVGCSFCIDIGSYMLTSRHGVTPEQVRAMNDPEASGLFTPAELVALDLATAMSTTPPSVDDALWARASQHFGERELLELTAMIGWENARARISHALGVESHGFAAADACARPTASRSSASDRSPASVVA